MCARCAHLCAGPGRDGVHFSYSAVLCTCSLNSIGTTLKSKVKPWVKVSGTPLLVENMCLWQGLFGEGAHWVLGRVDEAPAESPCPVLTCSSSPPTLPVSHPLSKCYTQRSTWRVLTKPVPPRGLCAARGGPKLSTCEFLLLQAERQTLACSAWSYPWADGGLP